MSALLRRTADGRTMFWCPGCECAHGVNDSWTITDGERPTIRPSVLAISTTRCHLFVTNGRIEFLADCTHALAGMTLPMEPMP